jgi:hypothetical protein
MAIAVLVVVGIGALKVFRFDPTAPYVVRPTTVSSADTTAQVGSVFDSATHTLSVVSDTPVVVVADPGKSFKYEVVWVVADPRPNQAVRRCNYRFALSEYAKAEHVNPLGTALPPEIQKTATDRW